MKLNRFIDHTLLSPFATTAEIEKLCKEALEYNFYAVCVSPFFAKLAHDLLINSTTAVAIVVGFPYGYNSTKSKSVTISETNNLINEVDVVINLQALLSEDWNLISEEIHELTNQAHENNLVIKWIVESGNISTEQLTRLCAIANHAKIDFMKTSTGMLGTGATMEAVETMRRLLDDSIQIKASGGIRDRATALRYIQAGASRIGASKGIEIVQADPMA